MKKRKLQGKKVTWKGHTYISQISNGDCTGKYSKVKCVFFSAKCGEKPKSMQCCLHPDYLIWKEVK